MIHFDSLRQWLCYLKDTDTISPNWVVQPNIAHATLNSLVRDPLVRRSLQRPTTLFAADLDNTCRSQPYSNIYRARFGEITQDELALMEQINTMLCRFLVITNQSMSGHVVAQFCSWWQNYTAYPAILKEKNIDILGSDGRIPVLTTPYKATDKALADTQEYMRANPPKDGSPSYKHVIVAGDRVSDVAFANRLYEVLKEQYDPMIIVQAFLLNSSPPVKHTSPELSFELAPISL